MNCKHGEMAALVRDTYGIPQIRLMVGQIVHVERRVVIPIFDLRTSTLSAADAWTLKTPYPCPCCGQQVDWLFDADLQPIRGRPAAGVDDARKFEPEVIAFCGEPQV